MKFLAKSYLSVQSVTDSKSVIINFYVHVFTIFAYFFYFLLIQIWFMGVQVFNSLFVYG